MRHLRRSLVALLALVLLAACSAGNGGEGTAADSDGGAEAEYDAADEGSTEQSSGADGTGGDGDRHVITTAQATVVVDDPGAAVAEVTLHNDDLGGYVESRRERADEDGETASASLTLRVPAAELDGLLESLTDVGEVTDLSQDARDVTDSVRNLDARIEALETSVQRLLTIMEESGDIEQLLRAEETLSERQADLEALEAERESLGDQVAMSTLHLDLVVEEEVETEAGGLLGGLQHGWNALVGFIGGLLLAIGMLIPWLLAFAIPGLIVAYVVRRRRGERATAPPRWCRPRPGLPAERARTARPARLRTARPERSRTMRAAHPRRTRRSTQHRPRTDAHTPTAAHPSHHPASECGYVVTPSSDPDSVGRHTGSVGRRTVVQHTVGRCILRPRPGPGHRGDRVPGRAALAATGGPNLEG